MNSRYDYLIIGSGLFGSVFAYEAMQRGKKVLVLEKRDHIGGNCYTKDIDGINVHMYGPHIFHTGSENIWNYINKFAQFNNFSYRPKVNYQGKIYSFPINLFTLYQLWGINNPHDAQKKLDEARIHMDNPENLEDWILSQVGREIYEVFIKGYTTKQWGRVPSQLPASIIKRLPIRLTHDDYYYHDGHRWTGIPIGGYTQIFEKMLMGADVVTGVDYLENRVRWGAKAEKVLYTGSLDSFYQYRYGRLDYRSLKFEHETIDGDFQGTPVIYYTEQEVPYTRIIEHKHFEKLDSKISVITREYPKEYLDGDTPYYPINDERNNSLYNRYKELSDNSGVMFGGRLARYQYYDMDQVIASALKAVKVEFGD